MTPPGNPNPLSPQKTSTVDSTDLNALRVKVAELCGWEQIVQVSTDCWEGLPPVGHEYGRDSGHWQIPNYPRDLNACAEFEKGLPDRRRAYMDALCAEVGACDIGSNHFDYADLKAVASATAEQRCRAFVATMEGRK